MAIKLTYNYIDVLTEIRQFFHRHKMVNSFVDNQVYDFASKENIYSAVVLVPTTSSIIGEVGTQLNLSFDLYFIDRLTENNDNAKDVYNDELDIALDFVAYFSNRNGKWNISADSVSLEPFEQKFSDDLTGGWRLSCSVMLPYRKNVCDIPLYDEEETDLPPVADFVYAVNGLDVTFTNKSKHYKNLQWIFPNSNGESIPIYNTDVITINFASAGTYTIKLTASKQGYEDSILTKTITIL